MEYIKGPVSGQGLSFPNIPGISYWVPSGNEEVDEDDRIFVRADDGSFRLCGEGANKATPKTAIITQPGWKTQRFELPHGNLLLSYIPGKVSPSSQMCPIIGCRHVVGENSRTRDFIFLGWLAPGVNTEQLIESEIWRDVISGIGLDPHSKPTNTAALTAAGKEGDTTGDQKRSELFGFLRPKAQSPDRPPVREPPPLPLTAEDQKGKWLTGGRTVIWCGWRVQIPPSWHFFYDGPSVHGQSSLVVETLDTGVNFYLEDPPPNWKWNDLLSDDRIVQSQVVDCTENGLHLYGVYFPPRKDGYSYLNFRLTANEDTTPVCLGGYISRTRPPTAEEKEALRSLLFSVEAEESTGKKPHPGPGGPENNLSE